MPAVELHGNLSQSARTRNMDAFHSGKATTLVATDIAARGIHVDDVTLVVHADPPVEHKAYLHRSGRTARAGAAGTVVTLMTDEQVRDVRDLTRAAGIKPTDHPDRRRPATRCSPPSPPASAVARPAASSPRPRPSVLGQPRRWRGRRPAVRSRGRRSGQRGRCGSAVRRQATAGAAASPAAAARRRRGRATRSRRQRTGRGLSAASLQRPGAADRSRPVRAIASRVAGLVHASRPRTPTPGWRSTAA